MQRKSNFIIILLIFVSFQISFGQAKDSTDVEQNKNYYKITIGKSAYTKKLWQEPYRYKNRDYKTLSVEVTVEKLVSKNIEFDFDLFCLTDEENKWRIRPVAMYYYQTDKKVYLEPAADNRNYNSFENYPLEGYSDIEAATYESKKLLSKKQNNKTANIKALPKQILKNGKTTYYLDFPVVSGFKYGKVYYKDKPTGFVARK
ncbi:MAG: hypothetical protein CR989_03130 [Flavobacteriales bacterium]|nr:MAG: hypothetical protein CR989_03130 [Flavobacteriales bacterium]